MVVEETTPALTPEQEQWVEEFHRELDEWFKGAMATEETLAVAAGECRRMFWDFWEVEVQTKATWRWSCCVKERLLPGGGILVGWYCNHASEDGRCPVHGTREQSQDTIYLEVTLPRVFVAGFEIDK